MQKQATSVFYQQSKILKSVVAFVAFVAKPSKCANAWKLGVIYPATLATITLYLKIYLLLLLPRSEHSGNTGNKLSPVGNKMKNHCCRTLGKKASILSNRGRKQHWQQKQHSFSTLFIGVAFLSFYKSAILPKISQNIS